MMQLKRRTFVQLAALAIVTLLTPLSLAGGTAKNVILIIGDGTGINQMQAASLHLHGERDKLFLQNLPHKGIVQTRSANAEVTDSAAGATAYAAGKRVNNGVISMDLPGTGEPLTTILEMAARRGMRTGIVTTDVITGATPGAFGAHVVSRKLEPQIAQQYLTDTRPDVLIGGGHPRLDPDSLRAAGYTVVADPAGLRTLSSDARRVAALFGTGVFPYRYQDQQRLEAERRYGSRYPELPDMAKAALNFLGSSEKGFFVMIEGALVDKSGHGGNVADDRLRVNIYETITLDNTVRAVVAWAKQRGDTLVLVTADHETGGLEIQQECKAGAWPTCTWAHKNHTAADVGLFGFGPGSEKIEPVQPNTRVFEIMTEALGWKQ